MKLAGLLLTIALVSGPFAGLLTQTPSYIFHGYVQTVPIPMPLGQGQSDYQILGTLTPDRDIVLTHFDVYARGAAVAFAPSPGNHAQCGTTIIVEDFNQQKEAAIWLPGEPSPTQDNGENHFAKADITPPLVIPAGDTITMEAHGELSCEYEASQMSVNIQYRAH